MKRNLLIVFVVLILFAGLTYKMLHLSDIECEVCVEFKGMSSVLMPQGLTKLRLFKKLTEVLARYLRVALPRLWNATEALRVLRRVEAQGLNRQGLKAS